MLVQLSLIEQRYDAVREMLEPPASKTPQSATFLDLLLIRLLALASWKRVDLREGPVEAVRDLNVAPSGFPSRLSSSPQ